MRNCESLGGRALLLLVALSLVATAAAAAENLRFVAIGDLPYYDKDKDLPEKQRYWQHGLFTAVIAPAIRLAGVHFVIHYGDFQGGSEDCVDDLDDKRRTIMALHDGPVFYTPGDNDWTDCDRMHLKNPVSALDRLVALRDVYFRSPLPLPPSWAYAAQQTYAENARWQRDGVLFATLHAVGSNSGREDIRIDARANALAEIEARNRANLVWLDALFAEAGRTAARAAVVAIHSDITDVPQHAPCSDREAEQCDGYRGFREALTAHAAAFGKPVLLLHGSTGAYCWEAAYGGVANLWRLNAAGDFRVNATVVEVAQAGVAPPFSARLLVQLGDDDDPAPKATCRTE